MSPYLLAITALVKPQFYAALATSLSWLVSRIQSDKSAGNPIPELVIKNDQNGAAMDIDIFHHFYGWSEAGDVESYEENYFSWRVARSRKGRKSEFKSEYSGAKALANHYRTLLSKFANTSLPLIAFYSVERVVLDIPLKIKDKHTFFQLDGYDKSLSQGVDFRRFFEWYREREDSENESGISDEVLQNIRSLLGEDEATWERLTALKASTKDRQLNAVRTAIYKFMPEFSNLRVKRKPRLHMSVDKSGKTYDVAQLSQGEKSLMALIGDIARRLSVMNPDLEEPFERRRDCAY